MGISDIIARFIMNEIAETDGSAELQRAELAQKFNCVPSQINYVISTRFSPEHGYIVESRRGGNGYIRITRVYSPAKQLIMHLINSIGDEIDSGSAEAFITNALNAEIITSRDALLIRSAISPAALRPLTQEDKARLRASILKNMLIATMYSAAATE
jgi:transcriptional regulator CtsR